MEPNTSVSPRLSYKSGEETYQPNIIIKEEKLTHDNVIEEIANIKSENVKPDNAREEIILKLEDVPEYPTASFTTEAVPENNITCIKEELTDESLLVYHDRDDIGEIHVSMLAYHDHDYIGEIPVKPTVIKQNFRLCYENIESHIKTETLPDSSNINSGIFNASYETGDKPYQCEHCGETFCDIDNFQQHCIAAHSEEKPFISEEAPLLQNSSVSPQRNSSVSLPSYPRCGRALRERSPLFRRGSASPSPPSLPCSRELRERSPLFRRGSVSPPPPSLPCSRELRERSPSLRRKSVSPSPPSLRCNSESKNSLNGNLTAVRQKRAVDKKREKHLQPEVRRQLLSMRAKKERGLFLTPDVPPKSSRKTSPEIVACPLKEGTPAAPPPSIPRPRPISSTEQPPSPLLNTTQGVPTFSLSTEIRRVSFVEAENITLMPANIELIGFSPVSSRVNSPQPSMIPSPQPSQEFWARNGILELDAAEDEALRNVAERSALLRRSSASPPSSRCSSEEWDRSPLLRRSSVSSPSSRCSSEEWDRSLLDQNGSVSPSLSYSPLSIPTLSSPSLLVDYGEGRYESASPAVEERTAGEPRGTGRARGGSSRGKGSIVRRGGGGRTAKAAAGDSGWRRGEPVKEVCLDDEDVPARLKEIVSHTESARRAVAMRERRRESSWNVGTGGDYQGVDEFQDADSFGPVQELFGRDKGALEFAWSPMATFSGREEEFQPENPGPTVNVSGPYQAFRVYWDDSILEHIVRETNRYAAELKMSSVRFARDWYDTNVHEIMILFAFWTMIGIIRMPTIKSCFSNNRLLKTDIFRTLMTEARYWYLNRALHFVNNATRTPDSSKLFSLGPLVDHLNAKFKAAYILEQKITIDESLTLWKGNCSFRQYIRKKAAHFGIKTFELCESATGYLWSFVIYTGKDTSARQSGMLKCTEIVARLMKPLLNKGHRLFLDNWFNSPVLARYLKRNKTDCVGTLRKSRKNVPALIQLACLEEGTCVARHSGDVVVMAYRDKQTVYTISTCHGTESVQVDSRPGRPSHYRPRVIADYNVSIGAVDKKDQMLEPYLIERKRNRNWYKKMFKRLLNVSIFNSSILLDKSVAEPVKQQAFRLQLVDEIMDHHLHLTPGPNRSSNLSRVSGLPPGRLDGGHHFIGRAKIDDAQADSAHTTVGKKTCLWCTVVEKRHRKTVYECELCKVPLCLEECFRRFHTQP